MERRKPPVGRLLFFALSVDEHAIAVAVEAVAGFHGMAVRRENGSRPAKAQTSASSVERGRWKLVSSASTTRKEKPGVMNRRASPRPATSNSLLFLRSALGGVFQRAHRGGADGQDGAPFALCARDALRGFWRNLIGFRMHSVAFQRFAANGLKCSQADVQRELANFNSARADLFEDFRSEVQAGGRRGDRAGMAGENSLVAFVVRGVVGAINVRRQRNMAEPREAQ